MTQLNIDQARRTIVEHTDRLAASAAAAGPDTTVPTTPGWTIAELVEHVGQVQHWDAEIVERRITDPAGLPTEMAVLPSDPTRWQAWLTESAQRVVTAFSDDVLDAAILNAAGDDRTGAEFWLSSVLNETVVHGFDAANTAGRPDDIDPEIAAALISNHLAMLTSPTWELMRSESAQAIRGTGQTLQWLATDTAEGSGAWLVERAPSGAVWRAATEQADVTVTGSAATLLLLLTRRLSIVATDSVAVDGDLGLVQEWLDNTAHIAD